MQATITRRFLVTALAVLGTTILPWLFYGKFLYEDAVKEAAEARKALEAEKLAGAAGDDLDAARKRLADAEKKVKAYAYELKLGLDLKGGASITYRVKAPEGQDQAAVLRDAIGVIQRRIDSYGVGEVNIVASGVDQFTVELPGRGKEEIDRIKSVMQKVGSLEFRIVAKAEMAGSERMRREREKEKYAPTPGYRWYPGEEEAEYLLEVPDLKAEADAKAAQAEVAAAVAAAKPEPEVAALRAKAADLEKAFEEAKGKYRWTGLDLESASYGLRPEGGRSAFEVHFSIVAGRKAAFGDFTGANIDRQMAIVLSETVHTAPVLQGKLSGAGSIFNDRKPFTPEECQDLVTVLKSGALASTPEEISSFVVGPGLGDDAVRRGRIAVGISFVLVMMFMAIYYRGAGWVANLAVLLNLVMTLGVLMFLGAALSLPGIAGLILTLGMAVDANILVNERIREEKAAGKGLAQAIAAGYDRAWITILDSNLTTILAGVFLYWIGTGPIRGFALTLILGLVISMFTACYVTRTIFLWGLEKGILKEFRMSPVMVIPAYPYTSMKLKTIGISAAVIILGTAAFVLRDRHDKYDLEFNGGERILVSLKKPLGIAEMRDRVEKVVRPGFEKAAAASGEAAKLGAVSVRTVRGPGADAGDLDLSTQSDRFELTAQVEAGGEERSEKAGRIFAAEVEAALAAELAPRAIPTLTLEGEPSKPERPFKAVVNLVGAAVDPAALRAELARVPEIVRAAETKVEKAATSEAGTTSFDVSGTTKAATDVALKDGILRALRSSAAVEPSDPIPQSDFIGPGVADRLRQQAILAILLSILAQIVYLRFRFRDYTYGFAAAIMVAHNVLITLGAVAVCDAAGLAHVKINLPVIGSFLTLIGYSVNDTIVVFDRIRENLGRSRHPSAALIDNAISQTLARSIRTSITVFFVVLTLFVANYGATSAIEGFGFVMVVGVVTSAYASVFISSPLLLFLPVYSRSLKRLGQPVVLGLIGALFVGLGIAFTQQGATAIVGGVFASLLPLHFVWDLFRWLPCKDPDALIREPEEAVAAAA